MRTFVLIFVACVVAAGAGYAAYRHWGPAAGAPETANGEQLPADIKLSDLDGHAHNLRDWQGKLVLINFWATWCGPCLTEIPELEKAQTEYGPRGFQVVGPAVDDPDAVRGSLSSLGINYQILVAPEPDDMIKTMESLGNPVGGLPFSVLVGADGKVLKRKIGAFTEDELKQLIEPNLPQAVPQAS